MPSKFFFLGLFLCLTTLGFALDIPAFKPLALESIAVKGSRRLSASGFSELLHLRRGDLLDDELVMISRAKLLSIGLFKSVLLYLERGSQRGWAKLVIEVEDEESVLGSYALDGLLAFTSGTELNSSDFSPSGIKMGLVARNLFRDLQRGSFALDVDGSGYLRALRAAYGSTPILKGAGEKEGRGIQFDASLDVIDGRYRYLDFLGYGKKAWAGWQTIDPGLRIFYGLGLYASEGRFSLLEETKKQRIAGPIFGITQESRLLGFIHNEGWFFEASILAGLLGPSSFEGHVARTIFVQGGALSLGLDSSFSSEHEAWRADILLEYPLSRWLPSLGEGALFTRVRAGFDRLKQFSPLRGNAFVLGCRFHTPGLIAEVSFQLSETARRLINLGELR